MWPNWDLLLIIFMKGLAANHLVLIFTTGYIAMKTVHDPNRNLTAKDLPNILTGIILASFLVGFLMLKYIFPGNYFVQKYTTGLLGVVNAFLFIILLGGIGFFLSKRRRDG